MILPLAIFPPSLTTAKIAVRLKALGANPTIRQVIEAASGESCNNETEIAFAASIAVAGLFAIWRDAQ